MIRYPEHVPPSPNKSGAAAGAKQPVAWRVKTDNGSLFGPADLETLKGWARDGRLAPTNQVSVDGVQWMPVTRISELEMDWVAEVSPGTFYGPIHHAALRELIRDNSLTADAAAFRRESPTAASVPDPAVQQAAAEKRLTELQADFAGRLAELENRLAGTAAESEQLRGQLSTRDLEFEAERQEFRASSARHQAELAKRDGRIATLEKENAALRQAEAGRPARDAKLAELERRCRDFDAELAAQRQSAAQQAEQLRASQAQAERMLSEERNRQKAAAAELEQLREALRSMRLRHDSLRKLLQQAASTLGTEDAREPAVIEAEPLPADPIPPRSNVSLAALEAQAQRELRRLGNKGPAVFQKK